MEKPENENTLNTSKCDEVSFKAFFALYDDG